jgi:hypothetical protein
MKQTTNCLNRTISCFFFFLLLSTASFGQVKEGTIKKIYLQMGGGATSHNGSFGEFGIQALLKHNWVATFSYHEVEMDPKNLPSDYDPGYSTFLFIALPGSTPSVDLRLYSLTAGKYFKTGRNTWFTTEAGMSFATGKKINFTRNTGDLSAWDLLFIAGKPSNYVTDEESKSSVGGMIKADMNWAFASFAGLGAGVFANINSVQSAVGFQVKLTCGWMNRTKKHS